MRVLTGMSDNAMARFLLSTEAQTAYRVITDGEESIADDLDTAKEYFMLRMDYLQSIDKDYEPTDDVIEELELLPEDMMGKDGYAFRKTGNAWYYEAGKIVEDDYQ